MEKRTMNTSCKHFKLFLTVALVAAFLPALVNAQASTNVSPGEFAGFTLVFDLAIPDDLATGATGTVPYTTDNSGSIAPGFFDRIAYYVELNDGTGPQFVWVSMDPFTTDPTKIGVPTAASGAFFQQLVSNMNIESNVATIATGTGITTGNIEFWPVDYATTAVIGAPGASDDLYDWDDKPIQAGDYASMQVHNHGAGQVLFGYNSWGRSSLGSDDLGIGNNTVANTVDGKTHPDWTRRQNAHTYTTTKILQVYVHPISQPPDCSGAAPSVAEIWPPNHKFVGVNIVGLTDPDGDPPESITITTITQDEPLNTFGDGNFEPDGDGLGTPTALVRAERSGSKKVPGNGRVYEISFTAVDGNGGEFSASVTVCVPHDQGNGNACIDDGQSFNSVTGAAKLTLPTDKVLEKATMPDGYELLENYPNPFNPTTEIAFAIPEAGEVSLSIYNLSGQLVRTLVSGQLSPGNHKVTWNATDDSGQRVATGIYLYVLKAGSVTIQKKLTLMK
jgi:hypothetical protein